MSSQSRVRIGRIGRPHGVGGEVALDGTSLTPLELHDVKTFEWRGSAGRTRTLVLATARPATNRVLVRFDGIEDRVAAAALTNGSLYAAPDRLPDPGPGVAYAFQFVGLRVETTAGRALGTLDEVMRTGANEVYVVHGEREWLIPAAPGVVRRVDLADGVMVVELPAGLEEL